MEIPAEIEDLKVPLSPEQYGADADANEEKENNEPPPPPQSPAHPRLTCEAAATTDHSGGATHRPQATDCETSKQRSRPLHEVDLSVGQAPAGSSAAAAPTPASAPVTSTATRRSPAKTPTSASRMALSPLGSTGSTESSRESGLSREEEEEEEEADVEVGGTGHVRQGRKSAHLFIGIPTVL